MNRSRLASLAVALLVLSGGIANAQMRITEWMYNPTPEFVEFTNVGLLPINMAGWSYDDSSRTADSVDLSGFGIVLPGESVLLAEGPAADFRTSWSIDPLVDIIGGNSHNLSRADEINLYNDMDALIDRLTYDDQTAFPGSIRTQGTSGNPITTAALGANDVYQWQFSYVGDPYGSYTNSVGHLGNPGSYVAIPEPASCLLMAAGAAIVGLRRCRK